MYYNFVVQIPSEKGKILTKAKGRSSLQIAAYYGRFCGAKRPQCEAERPGFLLI